MDSWFTLDEFNKCCKQHRVKRQSKLDSKSKQCIFDGYSEELKTYQFFDPVKRHILISRDVVFEEMETKPAPEAEIEPAPEVEPLPPFPAPRLTIRETEPPVEEEAPAPPTPTTKAPLVEKKLPM